MSESYGSIPTAGYEPPANDDRGKVDTAKEEAATLKDSAAEHVSSVAETAKGEAKTVAREASSQAKDLYAQTQAELKEQAGVQQQRVATGLRSLGDELGSMAATSENPGLASDLVRQASDRVGSAASWLGARDPGSLLNEVKSFARRKPGTFIAVAAITGVLAGRLTRALAQEASDEKADDTAASGEASTPVSRPVSSPPNVPATGLAEDTPVYNERASTFGDGYALPGEDRPR